VTLTERQVRALAHPLWRVIAPITKADSEWAIEKATAALDGVKALFSATPPERFS
jgi:hypothetical protein